MSAPHSRASSSSVRGVNVVIRRNGTEIHIDDIGSADLGRTILDEIDASILSIEDQLGNSGRSVDETWRPRAAAALRKKRRIRPALQQRIADLRREGKQTGTSQNRSAIHYAVEAKRNAFIMIDRKGRAPASIAETAVASTSCGASVIPTMLDVTAAWLKLPSAECNRIGLIAVDMVFQSFVYGDAYVATDQLEDLPVYDPDIRAVAAEAENRRLNELTKVVEVALPELFGKDKNPAWCEVPGTLPTSEAVVWAAQERAERAARQAALDAELEPEDA